MYAEVMDDSRRLEREHTDLNRAVPFGQLCETELRSNPESLSLAGIQLQTTGHAPRDDVICAIRQSSAQ